MLFELSIKVKGSLVMAICDGHDLSVVAAVSIFEFTPIYPLQNQCSLKKSNLV